MSVRQEDLDARFPGLLDALEADQEQLRCHRAIPVHKCDTGQTPWRSSRRAFASAASRVRQGV